tara:strand:+ start:330 stop:1247 length:918 start_codon:yes stop_codon:yes gene_type:complete
MSLARDIADLAAVTSRLDTVGASSGALSNRNLLINGAMQFFQRGTSFSASSAAYNADRWSVDNNGGGGGRSTDAPDDFTYSLKVDPASGSSVIRQAIELPAAGEGGVFRSGQKFTLSFYIKSDNAGEAINIFVASGTNVNATTTAHVNDTSTGLTTTTSWTRYTYTFTSNNVGGSDTCYNIVPYISSPSGDTYWTGLQLELGTEATPFEHRLIADELARCQRYFYNDSSSSHGPFACQYVDSHRFMHRFHPVEMRATPTSTVTYGGGTSGTEYNSSSLHFKSYLAAQYDATSQHYIETYQADAEL